MDNTNSMNLDRFCVRSNKLPGGQSGELSRISRESAGWEWMSFFVRRLIQGETWEMQNGQEETGLVVLGGRCCADWGQGQKNIGQRKNVFDGLPYALYLSPGSRLQIQAETECELAVCTVPSSAKLEPRLITPEDVQVSLRGGGNASRQIVDFMKPEFPADKLMMVEVYTPSGNWSSYPPSKHDVHNPPEEVDLDEIYYYRMDREAGYAHQRLYTRDGQRDLTLAVSDGDVVLVRDGYHPVVAGHGYNVYYLNCLAGSARSLANTEDPDHAWVRSTWEAIDPRLPIVGDTTR